MQLNVRKNAKRNIAFGIVNKVIVMLCPFVTRTVVQLYLGAQYLGLDSLFSSIIAVLSLSELGFSTAVVYHMYKPVSEGDISTVNALLNFYKKVYRIIGLGILAVGLCLTPFLPNLIKGSYPNEIKLYTIYFMHLANTVISYFAFAYLSSLITVYQRNDLSSIINSAITVFLSFGRVAILYFTKNYYYYVLLAPLLTVVNNIWIAIVVKKVFPQYNSSGSLSKERIGEIKKVVAGTFIQKACVVTRNSLDSICISMFLGLTLTAIYNNYYLIFSSIGALVSIICNSFMGGVGNHVAVKTSDENFKELQRLDFLYLWISGWCTICLGCLYQPFMSLWMGNDMLLSTPAVILLCLYFYILKFGDVRSLYNAANGLWWEQKWRSIAETAGNFFLNLVLGYYWGVIGIILATIISLVFCNCLWATTILFKYYFTIEKLKEHYISQMKYFLATVILFAISYWLCSLINMDNLISEIACRFGVCLIIPNVLYVIIFRKNSLLSECYKSVITRNV